MSSINQLVSEIAHSIGKADNVPIRRAIKLGIIHSRNTLIRQSYEKHHYTDQVLKQKFRISIETVPDGDLDDDVDIEEVDTIKRSTNKVQRPVRLTNNLPFHSVKTVGALKSINIPFVQEGVIKFYSNLPGMSCCPYYFYINDYIYFVNLNEDINEVIIEGVFEYPHLIDIEHYNVDSSIVTDDDEFFIPEDMVLNIKKLVLDFLSNNNIGDTNEVKDINLVK